MQADEISRDRRFVKVLCQLHAVDCQYNESSAGALHGWRHGCSGREDKVAHLTFANAEKSAIHVAECEIFTLTFTFTFECEATVVPAFGGEIGLAPRDAPLPPTVKAGEVRVQNFNEDERLFWVGGGLLDGQPHKLAMLVDAATWAMGLDEGTALAARQRANDA